MHDAFSRSHEKNLYIPVFFLYVILIYPFILYYSLRQSSQLPCKYVKMGRKAKIFKKDMKGKGCIPKENNNIEMGAR